MPYIAYSRAILGVFYELLFLSAKKKFITKISQVKFQSLRSITILLNNFSSRIDS